MSVMILLVDTISRIYEFVNVIMHSLDEHFQYWLGIVSVTVCNNML